MAEEPLAIEEIADPDNVRVMLFVKGKQVHAPAASVVTISTGTPATLSATSTNSISETEHTHEINTASVVADGSALLSAGQIGSYALLRHAQVVSTLSFGDARLGSNLQPSNAAGAGSPGAVAGTWRCMGNVGSTNVADGPTRTTLFLRIA